MVAREMTVGDLCVRDVSVCSRDTSLSRVGALMRKEEIGSLPVLDRQERVIGMVTDRDLALELSRREQPASEIYVDEIMCENPATCSPEDDVQEALRIMTENEVRRLPVVDDRGRLEGILSIDDIICHAAWEGDSRRLPHTDVIEAFCKITQHYQPETHSESRSRGSRRYYRRESPAFEAEEKGRSRKEKVARH